MPPLGYGSKSRGFPEQWAPRATKYLKGKDKTMNFADVLRNESKFTTTENGAVALNTTGQACLDFFSTAGALRTADHVRIERLFSEAFRENPLLATRAAFYARDVREGLGERETFRTVIRYMAEKHPEALADNIRLIPEYGRFDDLYSLVGTALEDEMWSVMKEQFEADVQALKESGNVSLLAKWIKTADASSRNTRKLGILTAHKLGYSVYDFKRIVRALRRRLDVVEARMSANDWDGISYCGVPSRAMMIYRNAFIRHDEERFGEYISAVSKGEAKINSSTLYPYDIVKNFLSNNYFFRRSELSKEEKAVLEAQWKALPDYTGEGINALVMADTSGSMFVMNAQPIASAVGLAIYFAERNKGDFHNLFMTFSGTPEIVTLKGETLEQKVNRVQKASWGMNTNLEAAFRKVLKLAVKNNTPADEMPKSIIVISDMEIDYCGDKDWTFYDNMRSQYLANGYDIPNVVFWNVNSRNDVFHADANRKGVQLVSGCSASTFRTLMQVIGMTPVEAMENVLNSERYAAIQVSLN